MNEPLKEDFSRLLNLYLGDIPKKDEPEAHSLQTVKGNGIDGLVSDADNHPKSMEFKFFAAAKSIRLPDYSDLEGMVDRLKEVHYDKRGNLKVPKELSDEMIRKQLSVFFNAYANRVVYDIFKSSLLKEKIETESSHEKRVTNKYQKIKDKFRYAVIDELMYRLSIESIARDNFLATEKRRELFEDMSNKIIRKNIYILLNYKYREEIKAQHDNGKRIRLNSYPRNYNFKFRVPPRRLGHQTLGKYYDWRFNPEYEVDGHNLQEIYFKTDLSRAVRVMKHPNRYH